MCLFISQLVFRMDHDPNTKSKRTIVVSTSVDSVLVEENELYRIEEMLILEGKSPYKKMNSQKVSTKSNSLEVMIEKKSNDNQDVRKLSNGTVVTITYQPVYCNVCGMKYFSKSLLKRHQEKEHNIPDSPPPLPITFLCNECERMFENVTQLERHARIHTDIRPFVCEICNKAFPWPEHLKAHSKTHFDMVYACSACGKAFSSNTALRRHEREHSDSFRYICEYCGQTFNLSEPYKIHVRKEHAKVRPFQCGMCAKRYYSRAACLRHTAVHNDQRLFSCGQCGKSFRNKQNVERHLLVHTGEKPFKCPHCIVGLATKHNLLKHIKTIHPEKEQSLPINPVKKVPPKIVEPPEKGVNQSFISPEEAQAIMVLPESFGSNEIGVSVVAPPKKGVRRESVISPEEAQAIMVLPESFVPPNEKVSPQVTTPPEFLTIPLKNDRPIFKAMVHPRKEEQYTVTYPIVVNDKFVVNIE